MSTAPLVCIVCPIGCEVDVELEVGPVIRVKSVKGNACQRGDVWARQEMEHPLRTLTSLVGVKRGNLPLASVRTTKPVPLSAFPHIMILLRGIELNAPVSIGEVLISKPMGYDTDIVVTRNVSVLMEKDPPSF
jgi:CxxC motif-containing protein